MNNIIRKSVASLGALIAAVFFLIAVSVVIISNISHARSANSDQDGRLITIHDRDTEKVILSEATTVKDAIREAGIVVDVKDAVEPALSEKLVASDYQINIYRARPVIIVDGNIRQKINTPYQTAEQIAASVGITIYPEDKTTIDRVDSLVDGVGLQLTIKRAMPFTFTLYGKTSTARTLSATVGQMLVEKNIKLDKNDKVSIDQMAIISEGMSIKVWREGKQTITVDEPVDFETEKIENIDLDATYREIKTVGQKGSRNVSYEVTIQDGAEVGRTEIASIITKQPVKQVEVVGAKGQYTTPSENESITWDFLIANGFSRAQTAGIMGNIMQEHKFNTTGDGLVQWTGSRKAALMSRPNPYNIYTQLDYLMYELNGGYAGVRDAIKATDSLESAVIIFQNRFERCGVCAQSMRLQYARNILASH